MWAGLSNSYYIFTWRGDCCLLLLVFSDDDTPVQIPLQRVLPKQVAIQHQQNNADTNVTNNLNWNLVHHPMFHFTAELFSNVRWYANIAKCGYFLHTPNKTNIATNGIHKEPWSQHHPSLWKQLHNHLYVATDFHWLYTLAKKSGDMTLGLQSTCLCCSWVNNVYNWL